MEGGLYGDVHIVQNSGRWRGEGGLKRRDWGGDLHPVDSFLGGICDKSLNLQCGFKVVHLIS